MSTDLYCMSCVPLRPGVWSIALLQVPKFNAKGKLDIFYHLKVFSLDHNKVSKGNFYRKALK